MTDLEQIEALLQEFRRPCPDTPEYNERLAEEFDIIIKQRLKDIKAVTINQYLNP